MSLLWLLALGAVRADLFEDVVMRLEITGDTELWDALFKGARQLETVVGDDKVTWSEGPLWTNGSLLFTDTITAKLHRYDPATRTLSTLAECAGGVCADAPGEEWRAEPGANGLALWSPAGGGAPTVLACQHGTARVVALDTDAVAGGRPRALSAGAHAVPIATHGARGRRLNGPNDLAVAGEWAYFTDPVYAFLELERFEDLPYLDEAVRERGAGVTGIYRARLRAPGASSPPPAAELLDASLSRPNGIAVLPPDRGAGATPATGATVVAPLPPDMIAAARSLGLRTVNASGLGRSVATLARRARLGASLAEVAEKGSAIVGAPRAGST